MELRGIAFYANRQRPGNLVSSDENCMFMKGIEGSFQLFSIFLQFISCSRSDLS